MTVARAIAIVTLAALGCVFAADTMHARAAQPAAAQPISSAERLNARASSSADPAEFSDPAEPELPEPQPVPYEQSKPGDAGENLTVVSSGDLTVTSVKPAREPESTKASSTAAPPEPSGALPSSRLFGFVEQKGEGELDVTYQSFYNRMNNRTIANTDGAAFSFMQFYPKSGLLSLHLEPLGDRGAFTTGDNFIQWKGLPWHGRHWDFALGDFHFNTSFLPLPFSNMVQPDLFLRGASITMRSHTWRYSIFGGVETLAQGVRVPFRMMVPQNAMGAGAVGNPWRRLRLGFRYLHLSSSRESIASQTTFFPLGRQFVRSDSLAAQAEMTLAPGLQWFTEAGLSSATEVNDNFHTSSVSFVTGPSWKTSISTVQANYMRQGIGYLPALGYYLGDRRGPSANATLHLGIFDFFGSWNESRNNVEKNPVLTDFFSRQSSGGVTMRLPLRFSLSGSASTINLDSVSPGQALQASSSKQFSVNLSRPVAGHNLRVGIQQMDLQLPGANHRLRFAEFEDTFRVKRVSLSGSTRWQRSTGVQNVNSLFFRGNIQVQLGRLSIYSYIEQGKDLANSTVFATNTVATSLAGVSWQGPRQLTMQFEAYRNKFNSNLNPESIFVLASQGIPIDTALSRLDNWSLYVRVSRRFGWGERMDFDPSGELRRQAPITGGLAGYVRLRTLEGNVGAPNVTVNLLDGRSATTDAAGYFEFLEIPEGTQTVLLDVNSLPAQYGIPDNRQLTVVVRPDHVARAELAVIPLQSLAGTVRDPNGDPAPEGVVIQLAPAGKYTTTDKEGRFSFYDVPEGDYVIAVEEDSLPEYGRLVTPPRVSIPVRYNKPAQETRFVYQIVPPPSKPLQSVPLGQENIVTPTPKPAPAARANSGAATMRWVMH